jgi:hypothetical protein
MNEDLIQLPEYKDVKEMLANTREDINVEIEEDSELLPLGNLLIQVIDIIEEKIAKQKDFSKLNDKEKIDLAAYLNFLQSLQDEMFFFDEEAFEDEEELDGEDLEEEETHEEK